MTTASLGRLLRDHRTGEVHIPHEPVAILGVKENLGRTLFGVKRQAGGESVLLADNLAGLPPAETADTGSLSSLQVEMGRTNQRFGPGWSEKTAMASEPYSLPRIPRTTTSDDRRTPRRGPSPHNGGENSKSQRRMVSTFSNPGTDRRFALPRWWSRGDSKCRFAFGSLLLGDGSKFARFRRGPVPMNSLAILLSGNGNLMGDGNHGTLPVMKDCPYRRRA